MVIVTSLAKTILTARVEGNGNDENTKRLMKEDARKNSSKSQQQLMDLSAELVQASGTIIEESKFTFHMSIDWNRLRSFRRTITILRFTGSDGGYFWEQRDGEEEMESPIDLSTNKLIRMDFQYRDFHQRAVLACYCPKCDDDSYESY